MLRPATPLLLAFLAAFVLLLLSTLSTPIIVNIPLGQSGGLNFGVFGYCKTGTDPWCSQLQVGYDRAELDAPSQQDYQYTPETRATLSYILIVHPVAAFMVLICCALAGAAHFRGPSHSPAFLLGLLIFTFPTLLVTLLAFLVDILLFIPHMRWGAWIVLPATIIVTACGVLTCAMRRTLVSRKARRKRIAENADMNGENYFAMKQEVQMRPPEPQYPRAESPPPLADPVTVASNDKASFSTYDYSTSRVNDDRTPLYPRDGSVHSSSTNRRGSRGDGTVPVAADIGLMPGTRDDDPLAYSDDPSGERPLPPYGYASGNNRGRGSFSPRAGYRGPRGGAGPMPYSSRGGMRGAPAWAGRGGPAFRGRAPPPVYGYNSPEHDGRGFAGYVGGADPNGFPHGRQNSWHEEGDRYNDGSDRQLMDGHRGSQDDARVPSAPRSPASFGFSGRQLASRGSPPPQQSDSPSNIEHALYQQNPQEPSHNPNEPGSWRGRPEVRPDIPVADFENSSARSQVKSSSTYYEDVDPRFSGEQPPVNISRAIPPPAEVTNQYATYNPELLAPDNRNDSRSPAHSDHSNFTSISERGINPNWQPAMPQEPLPPRRNNRNDFVLATNPDFALPGPRNRSQSRSIASASRQFPR